jgi:hypothetical protein
MTNNDENPQNVTEGQPHSPAASELVDRFDRELGEWFALHGGVWSGTAAELLAALKAGVEVRNEVWPRSPRALHVHIESHQQILHSLGMAVLLSRGHPRMISIRSCRDEQPESKPASPASSIDEISRAQAEADGDHSQSVCDDTAEALIAMLRTSATSAPSRSGTISKLAAAPSHLRTAFKRAWPRRPRAT